MPIQRVGELQIFVDAGFRENSSGAGGTNLGKAGLGVWVPSIGTGVALAARASDNNEAEGLAILLGLIAARCMQLDGITVLTDSQVSCDRLASGNELPPVFAEAWAGLNDGKVRLEWRPRETTSLADFFSRLALDGKNLVAVASNAKNPAERFRPLVHRTQTDKAPFKEATLKWLSSPTPPKNAPNFSETGLLETFAGLKNLFEMRIPSRELFVMVTHFLSRKLQG